MQLQRRLLRWAKITGKHFTDTYEPTSNWTALVMGGTLATIWNMRQSWQWRITKQKEGTVSPYWHHTTAILSLLQYVVPTNTAIGYKYILQGDKNTPIWATVISDVSC